MCCFKDFKNFERMNNLTQVVIHRAIKLIASFVPNKTKGTPPGKAAEVEEKGKGSEEGTSSEKGKGQDDNGDENCKDAEPSKKDDMVEGGKSKDADEPSKMEISVPEDGDNKASDKEQGNEEGESTKESLKEPTAARKDQSKKSADAKERKARRKTIEEEEESEVWTIEDKDGLFHMVTKVFMLNLPLYLSYKHYVHGSLEELSQQEFSALNNYCELSVSLCFSSVLDSY